MDEFKIKSAAHLLLSELEAKGWDMYYGDEGVDGEMALAEAEEAVRLNDPVKAWDLVENVYAWSGGFKEFSEAYAVAMCDSVSLDEAMAQLLLAIGFRKWDDARHWLKIMEIISNVK